MADLTNEELQALRRLEDAATPGPWEYGSHSTIRRWATKELVVDTQSDDPYEEPYWKGSEADLDILVAARNALLRLLDEVERLRAELERRERMDGEP